MGTNTETHHWIVKEWKHSVQVGCFHQSPPLKAQGCMQERRQGDCKTKSWWMTPGRRCLPYTAGLMLTLTHRDCDSRHRVPLIKARKGPSTEKGKSTWGSTPKQEATSNWDLLERENQFSSMQCHCAYQPQSTVVSIPKSNWPTQNELMFYFL